ncbi:MAG: hypothetical protein A3I00_05330 [Betaproteobacteria bacterium RIFCSPLOWO2_02_FULL_64_12]|nr:MAG: hypothetical protein A3G76_06255 [Acidobacteria bacterium RIFCSPLOWO2_12_FULL_65_11]OGA01760.1 MAG: hypothetical protein A3I00_05330 [Betaproteobacteria bacterium RIFCSPLOWO2_02_FULL_64_12]
MAGSSVQERLRRGWERWKLIAHAIGNFQARVLLTAFYFVLVPPFALVVKLFKDPLSLRPPAGTSYWLVRPRDEQTATQARRQF